MATFQDMQRFIRYYKDEKKVTDVDMHEVARFAAAKGWDLPTPKSPIDLLAREFSRAAREEIRRDQVTGDPYRANHAYPATTPAGEQLMLWVDIDEAPRKKMLISLVLRREQMVGDGLQLTRDSDHWNRINPKDEPIQLPMDLQPDIDWRKNAPDEDGKAN